MHFLKIGMIYFSIIFLIFANLAHAETCEEMYEKTYNNTLTSTSISKLKNQFHQYGITTLDDLRQHSENHSIGGSVEIDSVWADIKGSYTKADGTLDIQKLQTTKATDVSGEVSSEISTAFRSSTASDIASRNYGLCISNRYKPFFVQPLSNSALADPQGFNISITNYMNAVNLPITVSSESSSLKIIDDKGNERNTLDESISSGAVKTINIKRNGKNSGKISIFARAFPSEPIEIFVPELIQMTTMKLILDDIIEVNARGEWNPTMIKVKNGDTIRVQYISDKWNWGPKEEGYTNISGYDETKMKFPPILDIKKALILPSAPVASLIGKVSNSVSDSGSEKPFQIIDGQDYTIASSGMLYLSMNDVPGNFGDNDGQVKVKLSIIRKQPR